MYAGTPFGSIQSSYPNQMGTALAGQLANSSDYNAVDSIECGETNGIKFGLGVKFTANTGLAREGIGAYKAMLPAGSEVEADFAGVVARSVSGQTDSSGNAMAGLNRMAAIARPQRAGCRIWVKPEKLSGGTDVAIGDSVYWVIKQAVAGNTLTVGCFTNAAITSGGVTDTVQLTKGKFVSNLGSDGLALVEFVG